MLRLYDKDDTKRLRISFAIGVLLVITESTLIMLLLSDFFVAKILASFFLGVFVLLFLIRRVGKKTSNRVLKKMNHTLKTLDSKELHNEVLLIEKFAKETPKNSLVYAIPLFSLTRILYGPSRSEKYLEEAKNSLSKRKMGRLQRANFTLELCYHYLLANDIEMFNLAVKKLKTYHYTDYEKLSRKVSHMHSEHNPNEYKELAFISKLYLQGSDEEKIDKLLNHPNVYYRLIYTFAIMKYYESLNEQEKVDLYKKDLDAFEGDVFPLQRNEFNEF